MKELEMKEPKYYECKLCGKRMILGMSKHLEEKHGIVVNKTSDLARRFKAIYEKEVKKHE